MKFRFTFTLTAIGLILSCAPALADVVELKDGTRLQGSAMHASDHAGLLFRGQNGHTQLIPLEEIANITYSTPNATPYRYRAQPRVRDNSIGSAFAVSGGYQAPVKLKRPREERRSWRPDKSWRTGSGSDSLWGADWSGRVNAGGSLQSGNSDTKGFTADASIKANWGDIHRATARAEYNFEEDEGVTTEDNASLDLGYDYFFEPQWFWSNELGFERDELTNVDLRTTLSSGLGYQVYKRDDLNLQIVFGPSYLHEEFENDDSEDSLAARWALDYDQKIWDEAVQIFHDHEILIPADDTDGFLLESKTGARLPIRDGLTATGEIDFDWDNNPAPGIKEDDTKYSLKLGYEW